MEDEKLPTRTIAFTLSLAILGLPAAAQTSRSDRARQLNQCKVVSSNGADLTKCLAIYKDWSGDSASAAGRAFQARLDSVAAALWAMQRRRREDSLAAERKRDRRASAPLRARLREAESALGHLAREGRDTVVRLENDSGYYLVYVRCANGDLEGGYAKYIGVEFVDSLGRMPITRAFGPHLLEAAHGSRDSVESVIRDWPVPTDSDPVIPCYDTMVRDHGADSLWSADAVQEKPEILSQPALIYPPVLRQAGIQGVVTLRFIVDTTGRVERSSIEVVHSDNPGFNQPATDLISRMLFRPGREYGRAVRVLIQLPVTFALRH